MILRYAGIELGTEVTVRSKMDMVPAYPMFMIHLMRKAINT